MLVEVLLDAKYACRRDLCMIIGGQRIDGIAGAAFSKTIHIQRRGQIGFYAKVIFDAGTQDGQWLIGSAGLEFPPSILPATPETLVKLLSTPLR
jgi:hypothetical protein